MNLNILMGLFVLTFIMMIHSLSKNKKKVLMRTERLYSRLKENLNNTNIMLNNGLFTITISFLNDLLSCS